MRTPKNNSKIRAEHLDRQAFIYIRQSTIAQVRDHTGSTHRQYDLNSRAISLGWPQERIRIIDQDLGQSGASTLGRDGFQSLVAEVGLKRAGAVFCLEASRLARSCRDWYHLLEICALTDTLVIDEEGIYDPSNYNDRLLLGFKGTMSEAELHWMRQRLLGGKLAKAEAGELRFRLPVGLLYDPAGRIILDPDEEVRSAVQLAFDQFAQLHSARAVVTYFHDHQLLFPTRLQERNRAGELRWAALSHPRMLAILHDPLYAGAYVFGRTRTSRSFIPGQENSIKGRCELLKPEQWPIVLLDHHPAYLSWSQFKANLKLLDDNRTFRSDERRGVVREGAALLQGIALCGRCGRRMSVRYHNGQTPWYECNQLHKRLSGPYCQSLRGDLLDSAVADSFLAAIQPANLEISLAALDQIEARAQAGERQWRLRLERLQYEADLARRRFLVVDPANRLVARTLEHEWNERLAELERAQCEFRCKPTNEMLPLSPELRSRLLQLAQDIPFVWRAETTTHAERKQLIRYLIKDVTLNKSTKTFHLTIRWQTESFTRLEIQRPKKYFEHFRTSDEAVALIRQMAPNHTDQQIAAALNQAGFHSGRGGQFTAHKVQNLRYDYQIVSGCPEKPTAIGKQPRGDGRFSAMAAAELLNVDVSTIAEWCRAGLLDSIRSSPKSPRWIKLTPEIIAELGKPVRRSRAKTETQ